VPAPCNPPTPCRQARELIVLSLPVHDDVMMRMLEALVQVGATAKQRRQMVGCVLVCVWGGGGDALLCGLQARAAAPRQAVEVQKQGGCCSSACLD
jgi:hypothetical protein